MTNTRLCQVQRSESFITKWIGSNARRIVGLFGLGLSIVAGVTAVSAQEQHVRGQNIQPVYEGWDRNPDGSFNLHFGYLNRNWEEAPTIAVGPGNSFSPGPEDRGQPTHFYRRRQMMVF